MKALSSRRAHATARGRYTPQRDPDLEADAIKHTAVIPASMARNAIEQLGTMSVIIVS